jgi:TatD DNase family protein
MTILEEEQAKEAGGIIHCFTEDWSTAKRALDIGFYISLSGIVTFKSAKTLQEVAKKLPLDRILIETDSPYLAPVPHRGKTNQPAFVRHVAEFLAELRGQSVESIAKATTANFYTLFPTVQ